MGSHSVTGHPAEVTFPPLPQSKLVLNQATPEGCKAELTQLAGYIPRWYTRPKTVTHPGTNRARRALTSFRRRTPLTIRHAANRCVQQANRQTHRPRYVSSNGPPVLRAVMRPANQQQCRVAQRKRLIGHFAALRCSSSFCSSWRLWSAEINGL